MGVTYRWCDGKVVSSFVGETEWRQLSTSAHLCFALMGCWNWFEFFPPPLLKNAEKYALSHIKTDGHKFAEIYVEYQSRWSSSKIEEEVEGYLKRGESRLDRQYLMQWSMKWCHQPIVECHQWWSCAPHWC